MYHVLRYALDSLTKFKLSQAIHSLNVNDFYANTSCHHHATTLTFDPLTLKVWSKIVLFDPVKIRGGIGEMSG